MTGIFFFFVSSQLLPLYQLGNRVVNAAGGRRSKRRFSYMPKGFVLCCLSSTWQTIPSFTKALGARHKHLLLFLFCVGFSALCVETKWRHHKIDMSLWINSEWKRRRRMSNRSIEFLTEKNGFLTSESLFGEIFTKPCLYCRVCVCEFAWQKANHGEQQKRKRAWKESRERFACCEMNPRTEY